MTQFISNNYEKKTSFEIVSNFIEFKSKSFEPIPNSHESVSIFNEHVSNFNESVSIFNELRDIKEKKKKNGYFIKIISNVVTIRRSGITIPD